MERQRDQEKEEEKRRDEGIRDHITHTHFVDRGQKSEEVRTINAGEKNTHREGKKEIEWRKQGT